MDIIVLVLIQCHKEIWLNRLMSSKNLINHRSLSNAKVFIEYIKKISVNQPFGLNWFVLVRLIGFGEIVL